MGYAFPISYKVLNPLASKWSEYRTIVTRLHPFTVRQKRVGWSSTSEHSRFSWLECVPIYFSSFSSAKERGTRPVSNKATLLPVAWVRAVTVVYRCTARTECIHTRLPLRRGTNEWNRVNIYGTSRHDEGRYERMPRQLLVLSCVYNSITTVSTSPRRHGYARRLPKIYDRSMSLLDELLID